MIPTSGAVTSTTRTRPWAVRCRRWTGSGSSQRHAPRDNQNQVNDVYFNPLLSHVESRGGAYPVGIGGSSGAFGIPGRSPIPVSHRVSSPRWSRTRRADLRHRALQWNHATRTRVPGRDQRYGSRERWHHARTTLATWPATNVVRPVDALATATMQVVPFACACDESPEFLLISGVLGRRPLP